MSGGNGRADSAGSPITYFQPGKGAGKGKTKAYVGDRVERPNRYKHDPANQALLDDFRDIVKNTHTCQMPQQLQDNAIGIVNAGEEISGNESFKKGIEVSRETIKAGHSALNKKNKMIDRVLMIIAGAIALYVIQKMGWV